MNNEEKILDLLEKVYIDLQDTKKENDRGQLGNFPSFFYNRIRRVKRWVSDT